MALFSSKPESDSAGQTTLANAPKARISSPAPKEISLIGQGAVLEGTLRIEGDIRVSGKIIGQLYVQGRAIVAQEGSVEGDIVAAEAEIAGQVKGKLQIENRLTLRSMAKVKGDLQTRRLVLEDGARFEGQCKMGTPSKQSQKRDELPHRQLEETPPSKAKSGKADAKPEDVASVETVVA